MATGVGYCSAVRVGVTKFGVETGELASVVGVGVSDLVQAVSKPKPAAPRLPLISSLLVNFLGCLSVIFLNKKPSRNFVRAEICF